MPQRKISDLTPTEFENLTYDLLQFVGLRNLVWRTPGADGGRDIEGVEVRNDLSGNVSVVRWYVECKQYTNSIDWPTIWKKIAYAESNEASFLLLVTSNNPTPTAETEITKWNLRRDAVQIRVWRGYQLDQHLASYPSVRVKYGLAEAAASDVEFLPLLLEITKMAQASYVANDFGSDPVPGLEAAAALAELVSLRMDQVRRHGHPVAEGLVNVAPDYGWLSWQGDVGSWEEAGLRALLASHRYLLAASGSAVSVQDGVALVQLAEPRGRLTPAVRGSLARIAMWANIEVELEDTGASLKMRPR